MYYIAYRLDRFKLLYMECLVADSELFPLFFPFLDRCLLDMLEMKCSWTC